MFTRTFDPKRFLRQVYGTEPFSAYCHSRKLPFEQVLGSAMKGEDYHRWQALLRNLPGTEQTRIDRELAQVNELADADAISLLVESANARELPPDSIPGETALALWFFLKHEDLFQEVFLNYEVAEVAYWRTARAKSGITLDDLPRCQVKLATALKDLFRVREGTGQFCAVDAYQFEGCYCFAAHLSDRLSLFEIFTEQGEYTAQTARLSFAILFVYYPADGRILLKTRHHAADKILALFQSFGRAVLHLELEECCLELVFRLDLLKRRFAPLPDAPDMEAVRVKTLHLAYPERIGRRRLKLETIAGDHPFAVVELLQAHGGGDTILDQLTVVYAELELRLRMQGRTKVHIIRLWHNRSNINETALGERLRACLIRWGIADGG